METDTKKIFLILEPQKKCSDFKIQPFGKGLHSPLICSCKSQNTFFRDWFLKCILWNVWQRFGHIYKLNYFLLWGAGALNCLAVCMLKIRIKNSFIRVGTFLVASNKKVCSPLLKMFMLWQRQMDISIESDRYSQKSRFVVGRVFRLSAQIFLVAKNLRSFYIEWTI